MLRPNCSVISFLKAYRICIMASKGACRIAFKAEAFGLEKFGNYKTSPFSRSGVSSKYCVRDFIRIPEGSSTGFLHTASHDRYCGGQFNYGRFCLNHFTFSRVKPPLRLGKLKKIVGQTSGTLRYTLLLLPTRVL